MPGGIAHLKVQDPGTQPRADSTILGRGLNEKELLPFHRGLQARCFLLCDDNIRRAFTLVLADVCTCVCALANVCARLHSWTGQCVHTHTRVLADVHSRYLEGEPGTLAGRVTPMDE
jgi:hypothetical protein